MDCVEVRLRELRKERGVSQQALADAVGVTRQTIIAIEKGKYLPSLTLALKIAKFFNVPVEKVFVLKRECYPKAPCQRDDPNG